MYGEATAHKILRAAPVRPVDGDIEEGETGFDPDDAALDKMFHHEDEYEEDLNNPVTPLIYFAYKGDLKMMRYLISRGASTTKWVGDNDTPMQAAALAGSLDMCKLLHANGARDHVRLSTEYGWTPFLNAAYYGYDKIVRWLVLHGALCDDDNSDVIVGDLIHNGRNRFVDVEIHTACRRLVDWSKDVLQEHFSVINFLLGTLPPTPKKDRKCILQCLSGHPGIRKLIGDFVGLEVTKAKQLRILRSVVKVLPETMRIGRK